MSPANEAGSCDSAQLRLPALVCFVRIRGLKEWQETERLRRLCAYFFWTPEILPEHHYNRNYREQAIARFDLVFAAKLA